MLTNAKGIERSKPIRGSVDRKQDHKQDAATHAGSFPGSNKCLLSKHLLELGKYPGGFLERFQPVWFQQVWFPTSWINRGIVI